MFSRLRTKLTVLYAGLFGVALVLVSVAVWAGVSANARKVVRGELLASGTAFDRLWALRAGELESGAGLLSRDFGFREAVASRDQATIRSALENLRVRLGIDMAFIVGVDGRVTGLDGSAVQAAGAEILRAAGQEDSPSGVMQIGGTPYQTIAAPIMSPTLVGWVVFASRLDPREMTALERLSAIPLDAAVLGRNARDGAWSGPPGSGGLAGAAAPRELAQMIDAGLFMQTPEARDFKGPVGDTLTLVKPLKSIDGGPSAALLLSYPMARAMAPYEPLAAMIAGAGLAGMALLVFGSWLLARSVTRPITALDEAAQRVQRGEEAALVASGRDEIGRLGGRFNAMAAEIRERERRITHLALHDVETGLPNRRALEQSIEALATQAAASGSKLVALALGVDRFADVRAAIGYGLAGSLVAEVGSALLRTRPGDPVARLANGLLCVVFAARDLDEARRTAGHLAHALEAPVRLGENTIDVTLTGGLAAYPDHAADPASLLNLASVAVDQARAAHRKVRVFDAEAYGDPAAGLSLMSDMLSAIKSGEIYIHLQPKYDLRQQRTTGAEALVRWRHPARGMVGPDSFIPMAEETGHIRTLTSHVLSQAIAQQAELKAAGHDIAVSVNISGRLMGDNEFAEECLEMAKGAAGELCLEITETAVISNPARALEHIEKFAAAGLKISIDDYGSGLSSLAYLKQMRAHEMKIDKAFVIGMAEGRRDALLVRSTVDLAHSLGMKITAEGVETPAALALLSAMGCDLAQGYFIARPMALADLMLFLEREIEGTPTRLPPPEVEVVADADSRKRGG